MIVVGSAGGVLRIAHRRSAERCLIRGFNGQVVDVTFANILNEVVVAVVDEVGKVYVYAVDLDVNSKVKYPFVGQIFSIVHFWFLGILFFCSSSSSGTYRLTWHKLNTIASRTRYTNYREKN